MSGRVVPFSSVYAVPRSSWIAPATASASSQDSWPLPACSMGRKNSPFPAATLRLAHGSGALEPPLVVRLRGERGELRPQAPGALEEDPAIGRHGHVLAQEVLEDGDLRFDRHLSLRDLRELVRVAEEDEVARGVADRERVGQ